MEQKIIPINGGGKWQVAFWAMTVLLSVGLVGTTSAIVTNDRLRQSGDIDLMCQIDSVKDDFNDKIDTIKDQNNIILTKVVRLETLLSRR